eukprot:356972-Chlamydomonas_euryale.AAC.1
MCGKSGAQHKLVLRNAPAAAALPLQESQSGMYRRPALKLHHVPSASPSLLGAFPAVPRVRTLLASRGAGALVGAELQRRSCMHAGPLHVPPTAVSPNHAPPHLSHSAGWPRPAGHTAAWPSSRAPDRGLAKPSPLPPPPAPQDGLGQLGTLLLGPLH